MRRVAAVAAIASLVWLSPGLVHAQAGPPPARYSPLVHGWESFFKVTWEPMERRGRPRVGGYVSNEYGFTAMRVQLLVDGLDQSGRVVSQSVSWLGSPIPPGARVYFDVPAPRPAASYRVSVFAFEWLQTASVQTP
jgi:hypothetical protein